MPIRINLLAEQQAAEEMRRRDPVKRAMWVAGVIVGVMLLWGGRLQIKLMSAMHEVNGFESEWKKLEPEHKKVTSNLETAAEAERKWQMLQSLAANRFLWANSLNALQYVIAKVDDVQVLRLKTDQSYAVTEGAKPSTNADGTIKPGKPGTSREKVTLMIDAKDYSKRSSDTISKLQDTIYNYPYFKTNLQKVELMTRSPEMAEPDKTSRRFVTFTLECHYTEKTR
jgi:hypothetical protein